MAKRVSEANQTGNDLQIDQVTRRLPARKKTETHLFPAGVDDYFVFGIRDDFPEAIQRANRERIDEIESVRGRHLNETKVRMVTVLANKLGIETKAAALREMIHAGSQLLGPFDHKFGTLRGDAPFIFTGDGTCGRGKDDAHLFIVIGSADVGYISR